MVLRDKPELSPIIDFSFDPITPLNEADRIELLLIRCGDRCHFDSWSGRLPGASLPLQSAEKRLRAGRSAELYVPEVKCARRARMELDRRFVAPRALEELSVPRSNIRKMVGLGADFTERNDR